MGQKGCQQQHPGPQEQPFTEDQRPPAADPVGEPPRRHLTQQHRQRQHRLQQKELADADPRRGADQQGNRRKKDQPIEKGHGGKAVGQTACKDKAFHRIYLTISSTKQAHPLGGPPDGHDCLGTMETFHLAADPFLDWLIWCHYSTMGLWIQARRGRLFSTEILSRCGKQRLSAQKSPRRPAGPRGLWIT